MSRISGNVSLLVAENGSVDVDIGRRGSGRIQKHLVELAVSLTVVGLVVQVTEQMSLMQEKRKEDRY